MSGAIVVMTTFDNEDAAREMSDKLVEARMAACVQLIGPVTSTYRWQGKIEKTREWLALIKTRAEHWEPLEKFIRERHPYDTPEILALPAEAVSGKYLAWLMGETAKEQAL